MRIAVVGAGFAGLSAAWHLSPFHQVTLFDQKGIGCGASGVAAGLLHPYPGVKGNLSWHALEAMQAARKLLNVAERQLDHPVANYKGIIKRGQCLGAQADVEVLGENLYLIRSGITVFVNLYLDGLWKACAAAGVKLQVQTIDSLHELERFDLIILCAGYGIRHFPECHPLRINFVKGQALTCRLEKPMVRSEAAKTYTALTEDPAICHVGGTYERTFLNNLPELETAVRLLEPKHPVLSCQAGVRVTNPAHYFPLLEKVTPKCWALTAFGSRGLLYHGYMGEKLKAAL